jgi:hypothetical protein
MAHFTSVETMMLMCDLSSSSIVFVMTFCLENALQNAHKYATGTVLKTIPSLPKKD